MNSRVSQWKSLFDWFAALWLGSGHLYYLCAANWALIDEVYQPLPQNFLRDTADMLPFLDMTVMSLGSSMFKFTLYHPSEIWYTKYILNLQFVNYIHRQCHKDVLLLDSHLGRDICRFAYWISFAEGQKWLPESQWCRSDLKLLSLLFYRLDDGYVPLARMGVLECCIVDTHPSQTSAYTDQVEQLSFPDQQR